MMDVLIKKIMVTSEGETSVNVKPNRAIIVIEKPLHYTSIEDLEELRAELITAFNEVFFEDAKIKFNLPDNIIPGEIE